MSTNNLTKFRAGSFREILVIAIPLMLSYLSSMLMLFADRLILSYYSLDAMNAAVIAGNITYIFLFLGLSITSMSELVIGRLNGQKLYEKIGMPISQVLWLSLCFSIFYILLAFTTGDLFLPAAYYNIASKYYELIMLSGVLTVLNIGLMGFFIGIGKAKIIIIATIIGNLVNIILDILFVFGYKDIIPEMGMVGAAYATLAGLVIAFIIIALVIWSKKVHEKYHTRVFVLDIGIIKELFKAGGMPAIGYGLEMLSWYILLYVLALVSEMHISVLAIGQTLFLLTIAFTDSIKKSVVTICSNLIGSKRERYHRLVMRSALRLHSIIALLFLIMVFIIPQLIISVFIADNTPEYIASALENNAFIILIFVFMFYYFDGICWIYSGFLISKGRAAIVMVIVIICSWCFGSIPISFGFYYMNISYKFIWMMFASYALIEMLILQHSAKKIINGKI